MHLNNFLPYTGKTPRTCDWDSRRESSRRQLPPPSTINIEWKKKLVCNDGGTHQARNCFDGKPVDSGLYARVDPDFVPFLQYGWGHLAGVAAGVLRSVMEVRSVRSNWRENERRPCVSVRLHEFVTCDVRQLHRRLDKFNALLSVQIQMLSVALDGSLISVG